MELNNTEQDPEAPEQGFLIGHIIEGFLSSIPSQVAEAIRLGAIPHWFDSKLLSLMPGEADVTLVVTYLQRFRFVRQDAQEQFRYHDEIRDYLLTWWRKEHYQQYEEANRVALTRFKVLAETATPVERPLYERELLYHLLIVDEAEGLRYLSTLFEEAYGRYQLGLAEQFVSQAVELKNLLTNRGGEWVRYFEARLDLVYHRDDAGEATFEELAEQGSDLLIRAMARWSLGEIRVNQQRWSQAIRLYHASLDSLQQEQAGMYTARIMLALGKAYCDLADNSGGLQTQSSQHFGLVSQFLYGLQHLPFLVYEWLVRRVNFLPNWYFGTNYQDWIIAYLLVEARRWYSQAERQFKALGSLSDTVEARLALAELEHQLGRWSRARRRYSLLLETDEIKGSLYRTARVQLGQGRTFLDEGALLAAEATLVEALETFRRFHDNRSIGMTAALLGRTQIDLGRLSEGGLAYIESIRAFEAVGDQLARTQIIWALKELLQHSALPDERRQQIEATVAQVTERHYITRFPETLLRRFRKVALLGALPLTYVLTFVIGLALTLSLSIIEGEFLLSRTGANAQTAVADVLIIIEVATLPVLLALWLYRLIYSLMGVLVVHFLGRRLIPIEREQPSYLVTDTTGLTRHDVSKGLSLTMVWPNISLLASIDYHQRQRPIRLISSTVVANFGMIVRVDAVTAGYDHLKQDMAQHLAYQARETRQQNLDFIIFDSRWVLVAIMGSLALAFYFPGKLTYSIQLSDETVPLLLSSIAFSFVPTLLLLFPTVVLWRLVGHRIAVRRILSRYQIKPIIPFWILWLAAIACTLITIFWISLLVSLSR